MGVKHLHWPEQRGPVLPIFEGDQDIDVAIITDRIAQRSILFRPGCKLKLARCQIDIIG